MDVNYILDVLQKLLIVTMLCECTTESIKLAITKTLTDQQKQAISFTVGIVICLCGSISLFEGSLALRLVGAVLAGLLAGRGGNYIHSLIEIFGGASSILKNKAQLIKKDLE